MGRPPGPSDVKMTSRRLLLRAAPLGLAAVSQTAARRQQAQAQAQPAPVSATSLPTAWLPASIQSGSSLDILSTIRKEHLKDMKI